MFDAISHPLPAAKMQVRLEHAVEVLVRQGAKVSGRSLQAEVNRALLDHYTKEQRAVATYAPIRDT